jgi:hypothetical protein
MDRDKFSYWVTLNQFIIVFGGSGWPLTIFTLFGGFNLPLPIFISLVCPLKVEESTILDWSQRNYLQLRKTSRIGPSHAKNLLDC